MSIHGRPGLPSRGYWGIPTLVAAITPADGWMPVKTSTRMGQSGIRNTEHGILKKEAPSG